MLMVVVLVHLALPPILATLYAIFWPTVPSRVGLFITLGSLFGLAITLAILFWVAQPLVGIGITGARRAQPASTLWSLLGPRMLAGIFMEVVGMGLILVLLARGLRCR